MHIGYEKYQNLKFLYENISKIIMGYNESIADKNKTKYIHKHDIKK